MIACFTVRPGAALWLRRLGECLLLLATYYISARILITTLLITSTPNLFWLPAGIAVTGVLLRGNAMLPVIFVAALLVQYRTMSAGSPPLLPMSAAVAIGALGATLQPWLTARLLKRHLHSLQILHASDTLKFILCTAIGAIFSAAPGTFALWSQGKLADDMIVLNLLSWWVGDFCGVLIVAPAALALRYWRRGKREWSLLSLPIIGLGCSFTLVSAFLVKHLDHDARINAFMANGIIMGQAMQRSLELYEHDIATANTLFYNYSPDATEFRNFATYLIAGNPMILSVNWAPLLTGAQRQAFEAKTGLAIRDIQPDGTLDTAAPADAYLPIQMSIPESKPQSSLGANLMSEPKRLKAIQQARATGEARATALIRLARGGTAVLVLQPVYQDKYRYTGNMHDSANLRSFITMTLKITDLAREALHPFDDGQADVWLIDMTTPGTPQLLYQRDAETAPADDTPVNLVPLYRGVYQETWHKFAGRDWVLISKPRVLGAINSNGQFIGILVAGFGLTLMLAFYMIGLQRRDRVMQERDDRLTNQNAVLTNLAHVGLSPDSDRDTQLRELLATSAITLHLEYVGLWRIDRARGELRCALLFKRSSGEFISVPPLELAAIPTYLAELDKGRAFVVHDVQSDPRTIELAKDRFARRGVTSIIDVPLRIDGRIDGVVTHAHVDTPRVWAQDEQNFSSSIGDLAALVIESARRHEAERALQASYHALETKVEERTEELRQANERLLQLDHLKSMFIASMSHELRTPLNAIIGFTGIVLQGVPGALNATQTDYLNRVSASAKHLLSLITDVIDISKIEAGYADARVETFPLKPLIEEAVATVQPQRLEKGLAVELFVPDGFVAHSDRKRLLQCVINLLSNAVKYSERGTISIRARNENGRIAIAVEDTGIGIPPDAMDRLFQPFERIDSHLRIQMPGTGLGLYLTKKLVTELLRGDIAVTSTEGQGSCFTLWLPADRPDTLAHT